MNSRTIDVLKPVHTITEDDRLGIIRIAVSGFFDRRTLVEHFALKTRIVNRWRAQGRPICLLIDAAELKPHSPKNQAFVEEEATRLYVPQDRVAMLLESSLVKMQMRRALSHGAVANFFISENAAIMWLTAHLKTSGHCPATAWQPAASAIRHGFLPL